MTPLTSPSVTVTRAARELALGPGVIPTPIPLDDVQLARRNVRKLETPVRVDPRASRVPITDKERWLGINCKLPPVGSFFTLTKRPDTVALGARTRPKIDAGNLHPGDGDELRLRRDQRPREERARVTRQIGNGDGAAAPALHAGCTAPAAARLRHRSSTRGHEQEERQNRVLHGGSDEPDRRLGRVDPSLAVNPRRHSWRR